MKYFFALVLIVVAAQSACAQQIHMTTGIGTFAMKSMKYHAENLQHSFPVNAKFIDKFPAFPYYGLSILHKIGSCCYVGGSISYGSTGARINYTDYSGSLNADQRVRYFEFGGPFVVLLNPDGTSSLLTFTAKPTVAFGKYVLILSSRLGDQLTSERTKFTSTNFGIESGIAYSRKILHKLAVQIQGGYNFNFYKGDLIYSGNDSYFLQDKEGKKVTLDWSGIRGELGIIYHIKR